MEPPILVLHAGSHPTTHLAAEILRCEGFPWLSEAPLHRFDQTPPGVRLLIVAGDDVDAAAAHRLAAAAATGLTVLALAPAPELARALELELGPPLTDPTLTVSDLPDWEHGDLALLCPGEGARAITGGQPLAALRGLARHRYGAGLVSQTVGQGRVVLFGYDLCRTVAHLRHGTGALDPPPSAGRTWGGPRALYSFWGLSEKLPHTAPVADVHQDVLRCLVAEALAPTGLPRLWHHRDGAPSVFMVRGDGCGEDGADVEVEVVERHDAFLTFCRPRHSRFPGDLLRDWHARGHGISIEANINPITQQTVDEDDGPRSLTAAELNAGHLPAIRANLVDHRDSFQQETGLEMETFMTHGAQWTGAPMAHLARELGWRTLLPFQSIDPRLPVGTQRGPYIMPTGLPLRYVDRQEGVLDLWHIPYHWIDLIWQTVMRQKKDGVTDPEILAGLLGQDGDEYGARVAAFAESAARRWHVTQICSFHPVYVSRPLPHLGSSQRALEMALDAAAHAGAAFDNLERWSRFVRGRDAVRLTRWRQEAGQTVLELQSSVGVEGLALLVPDEVTEVRNGAGHALPLRALHLEGRPQRAVVLDLPRGQAVELSFARRAAGTL